MERPGSPWTQTSGLLRGGGRDRDGDVNAMEDGEYDEACSRTAFYAGEERAFRRLEIGLPELAMRCSEGELAASLRHLDELVQQDAACRRRRRVALLSAEGHNGALVCEKRLSASSVLEGRGESEADQPRSEKRRFNGGSSSLDVNALFRGLNDR